MGFPDDTFGVVGTTCFFSDDYIVKH